MPGADILIAFIITTTLFAYIPGPATRTLWRPREGYPFFFKRFQCFTQA